MHRFEVWAPRPERVELLLPDRRIPMERDASGWWRADVDDAGPGTRYAYSLDGGPPRPDPRSASQPNGVAGWSEVAAPAAVAWTDERWRGLPLAGAVLYEIHVGTFTPDGTFDAAIDRLPHLVELGVDAVELLPVAQFPGERGWGYDGVALFAPHHAYGGPDGLDRFVDACHAHGLGVVFDVVYNHLGPLGNHLAEFGPYFTDRHRTPWGDAVNVDGPGADEVRAFIVDSARHWLRDHHGDGLRLDAVHAIVDDSPLHLLEELAVEVEALARQLGRHLFLIAENDTNDPRLVRPRAAGGYGLHAAWVDDWHHALHVALTGEHDGYYRDYTDPDALPKALRQAWVLDGTHSANRGRRHGRPPTGLDPSSFVVCAQNHDQVGNRAGGDRLSHLVPEGRLHVAAALLLTTPFTPMLFQGEEWGASSPFQYFTDHPDPDLGAAVREGRRAEFGAFGWDPADVPDPQDPATFERSRLRWDELADPTHRRLLGWHRHLIALRRRLPALTHPDLPVDARLDGGLLRWRRGDVHVAANLGPDAVDVVVDGTVHAASPGVALSPRRARLGVDSVVVWSQP